MKKLISKAYLLLLIIIQSSLLMAQADVSEEVVDSTRRALSLDGSLDYYFHHAFNTVQTAPSTSFANLPGFSLGMVNLVGRFDGKKTGFVTDLVVGPRGTDAVFNAPYYRNAKGGGSAQIINQLFFYYKISNRVRLNLGQFNTFLGYETISPVNNFHYSTAYLFSFGPFNHAGAWADIDLSNGWSAKVAYMNPTDYAEYNPFGTYTMGGQVGFTKENRSAYFNAIYGDQDGKLHEQDTLGSISSGNSLQIDFMATWRLVKNYDLAVDASYRTIASGQIRTLTAIEQIQAKNYGFYGVSLYQKIIINSAFSMGLRTEYFEEFNNGIGALHKYDEIGKSAVTNVTLSANIVSSYFRFIPEVRLDSTSQKVFQYKSSGAFGANMVSVNLAVVYKLPTLSQKI